MAKTPGAMWVSGTDLHFIDINAHEWYITGTSSGATGLNRPSIWIDSSSNTLYYVDNSNSVRYVPNQLVSTNVASTVGHAWIDTFVNWIDSQLAYRKMHSDVAHTDNAYSDVPQLYSDSPGSYTDTPAQTVYHGDYTDYYYDHNDSSKGGHTDSQGGTPSYHSDSPHTDTAHGDTTYPHSDHVTRSHADVPYGDIAHADQPLYVGP